MANVETNKSRNVQIDQEGDKPDDDRIKVQKLSTTSCSDSTEDDHRRENQLGQLILEKLHHDTESYSKLVNHPLLMLEMMLMNKNVHQLPVIIGDLKQAMIGKDCIKCGEYRDNERVIDSNDFQEDHQMDVPVSNNCVQKLLFYYAELFLRDGQSKQHCTEGNSPVSPPGRIPWIPDEEAIHCMCCKVVEFTRTMRRHHCRKCGRIVCKNCSRWKKKIPHIYKNPVRHCDDCLGLNVVRKIGDHEGGEEELIILTGDHRIDSQTRTEFASKCTIDVESCLTILDTCEDNVQCNRFINRHMARLDEEIRKAVENPVPEFNYKSMANAFHYLTLVAKVRQPFAADWDLITTRAQIIKRLANLSLQNLIPVEDLNILESLGRLRNNLATAGMFKMAFDTSLLCGQSSAHVLLAWGVQCLKQDNFSLAREKLTQISQRIVSPTNANNWSQEIVSKRRYPEDMTGHQMRPKDTPPNVVEILKVLEENRDEEAKELESFYYLFLYGSHRDILKFMVQRKLWPTAFRYILDQSVDFEDFFEAVILTTEITEFDLVMLMRGSDPGLERWESYLNNLCSLYEKKNVLATIYNLQAALGDDIRAALTCIKFYTNNGSNYRCLLDHLHYLQNAEFHFKRDLKKKHHLQLNSGTTISKRSFKLVLPSDRIQLYLRTITLQKKITRYLVGFEDGKNLLKIVQQYSGLDRPISIFDHQHIRSLIVLIVSCDVVKGSDLAYEVLACFSSRHRAIELHQLMIDYFTSILATDRAVDFVRYARSRENTSEQQIDDCVVKTIAKCTEDKDFDRRILLPLINVLSDSNMR